MIAEELAKNLREISIAEFFEKNKHILGYSNPAKSLVTCVKEAVDNALDATEEAGILPDIMVRISKLDKSIRVKDLTTDQEESLRKVLADFDFILESDLKREISQNIKRLQDIGSYRGFRHRRRLPVRGQRTKTNSRTKRGKKGTVANKKKVTK